MLPEEELKEEERKLRYLQILISLTIQTLREGPITVGQAYELIEAARKAALNLFPGKEQAFQLIYEPRLLRTLKERWGAAHLH